jgi:hypothetical protein
MTALPRLVMAPRLVIALSVAMLAPAGFALSAGVAMAQDASFSLADPTKKTKSAKKPASTSAAPHERRPGELEGWNGDGKPVPKAKDKPADAIAEKPPAADGGLPLPREVTRDATTPVGIDPNGNVGAALKF